MLCGRTVHGEVETRGAEGQLIELSNYYEGIEHGPQQEWHENGQLKEKGITKMGVAVGQWWSWYPDGKPARQLVFDDNGWQTSRKRWDETGNVIEDKQYRKRID